MLEESMLEVLYRDLRARSQDEDAIQRVVVKVWQRNPPPDNPILYARQALWNEHLGEFRGRRRREQHHVGEGEVFSSPGVGSIPPTQLARVLARETLEGLDSRLVWDAVGTHPLTAVQRFRVWRASSNSTPPARGQ